MELDGIHIYIITDTLDYLVTIIYYLNVGSGN